MIFEMFSLQRVDFQLNFSKVGGTSIFSCLGYLISTSIGRNLKIVSGDSVGELKFCMCFAVAERIGERAK